MTSSRLDRVPAHRIHAIILTRDRPETLRRCLATAMASLGPLDRLTLLDDSPEAALQGNAAALAVHSSSTTTTRTHVAFSHVVEALSRSLTDAARRWLSKTAPRDIAPLRNAALLLARAIPADTTILIDDDIEGFNLTDTHFRAEALSRTSTGLVAGAQICGINESDSIERLSEAIDTLDALPLDRRAECVDDLVWTSRPSVPPMESACRFVSAGYLAFRLPGAPAVCFPPGYNEDWLWCLLQARSTPVSIMRLGEAVNHAPPQVRRPTREDVLFETTGDLVFDCLEEGSGRKVWRAVEKCGNLTGRSTY